MLIENTCPIPNPVQSGDSEPLPANALRLQRHASQSPDHRHIVEGNHEVLQQGSSLIQQLTDAQYTSAVETYACSSIGAHFRHMLDMYLALMPVLVASDRASMIDYDVRRRGAPVESCRHAAIAELDSYRQQLDQYTRSFDIVVTVKTEVCIESTQHAAVQSTLARELAFVSTHAVHHFALIKVIAKLLGASVDASVGLAPASASFMRSQQSANS
jgi:uncharacterized damage-inducible protein DinB